MSKGITSGSSARKPTKRAVRDPAEDVVPKVSADESTTQGRLRRAQEIVNGFDLPPKVRLFIVEYQFDPLRFAVEVCGVSPSADQIDLYQAMEPMDAKVSVVSGTSTGKTNSFGRIALWHLLCYPYAVYDGKLEIGSNTYIGAPNLQQVADGVWKEMQDSKIAMANGPHSWLCDYFVITKTRVYVTGFEEQWFVGRVALAKGQSVGIAGKHRWAQLIIVDEAAGVSDDHFDVIDGTQTQPCNRTLIAS
ncbi:hypothetical protein [Collimonas pratensis]|uniref:hypothetical protein n=1 Tax=Collimonas pratensis TaxID=279113 RepID=UPI0007809361|nr:hypothetical protein [Collimonas pratensis]